MQKQLDKKVAATISEVTMLPQATFMSLFAGFRFIYNNKLLSSKMIEYKGDVERGFDIDGFLYLDQTKFGKDKMAARRRSGELILNIIDKSDMKLIGRVINGKVFKL